MISLPLMVGAFVAGVLMFLAPCTLPIVPGYLAFIAGGDRKKIFINALAFVIGFSLVFIALGAFAAVIGAMLGAWRLYLARGAGIPIVLFGLTMLGVWRIPLLSAEWRPDIPIFRYFKLGRPQSSLLIGALFALGWSPCIGPILGTILFLASASATALTGALLLAVFSLGMSVPFLLCAAALGFAESFVQRAGRWTPALSMLGGAALVALGVLMLTGNMGLLISWGYGLLGGLGYDKLLNYL